MFNAVRRLGKKEFTTSDAYAFAREMENSPRQPHVKATRFANNPGPSATPGLSHSDRGLWTIR